MRLTNIGKKFFLRSTHVSVSQRHFIVVFLAS
jgi:hypothetical protein